MKYQYQQLKKKYNNFSVPVVHISVEGKGFETNQANMVVSEVQVHQTCGFQAGDAVFSIYGCTDPQTDKFSFDALKPYIALGSCAVLELGYLGEREEVFCGYIARVEFIYEEIPCVEVTLMDIKGVMMAGACAGQLRASSYGEAVREIFSGNIYKDLKQKGILRKLNISDTPDKQEKSEEGIHTMELYSESAYEFVVKAAKKFYYEFFVDCGDVYFRKAKSDESELIQLNMDELVLSMRVNYDIRGIFREAEVRSVDDSKGITVKAVKKQMNQLSYGNKVNALLKGTRKVYVDSSAGSINEAKSRAESLLEASAFGFGTLECECIGVPVLRPGHFIRLGGYGIPADNRFYVTDVEHILSEEGYVTRLTAQAASLEDI